MVLTERDRKLLWQINSFGVVTVEQLAMMMGGVRFTVAARRARQYLEHELVSRMKIPLVSARPLCLTPKGCQEVDDDLPPLKGIRAGELRHDLRLVDLAHALVTKYGGSFVPIRRLRHNGYAFGMSHLPDGVLSRPNQPDVAIELELSAKSDRRLNAILAEYAANLKLQNIWYITDREPIANNIRRIAHDQPYVRVTIWKPAAHKSNGQPSKQENLHG